MEFNLFSDRFGVGGAHSFYHCNCAYLSACDSDGADLGRIGDENTEFHRFCFPGGDYSVHGGNGNWRVDSRKNGTGMEFIYVITATLEDTFVVSPLLMFPVLKVIGMIGFRILAILDIFLMILVLIFL